MNSYLYEALIDIERRIQEILCDLRSIQEQVFYTYDPNADGIEGLQEELNEERKKALEFLATNKK